MSPETLFALTNDALFDFMAIRLNGPKAVGLRWRINWIFTDSGDRLAMNLTNCTLTHVLDAEIPEAETTVRISRTGLVALNLRDMDTAAAMAAGELEINGDQTIIDQLFALLDDFTMMFDVVAPSLPD